MSENSTPVQGRHLLTEKDFVKVVDAEGNDLPSVPKHWGSDLLPPGAEKKGRSTSSSSSSSSSGSGGQAPTSRASGQEPPRAGAGSGTDEWVAFAKEKGATDADLLDGDGKPVTRDVLIDKYGAPAPS